MSDIINYSKNEVATMVMDKVVEDGINNITVQDLVELLPFSRRTFFRIFECKEDLFFEIYKNSVALLNSEVSFVQRQIDEADRYLAIKAAIDSIIDVFIKFDKHVQFIIEFDALEIKSQSVSDNYDDFYMTINFIYYFIRTVYTEEEYNDDKLMEMSVLTLETIYGLVYRYSITKRANYKVRVDENNINLISGGLTTIIMSHTNKYI